MGERGPGFNGAGFEDRVYPPTKLAATLDVLAAHGIAAGSALGGTGLLPAEVQSPATRISLGQLFLCYENARRLSAEPLLAFRIGAAIHLSAYGMYGYAMLCSPDIRHTMAFAIKYHLLATPATTLAFAERNGTALWTIEPLADPQRSRALNAFVTQVQIGIHLSLHRDILGEDFVPREVTLSFEAPAGLAAALGCPVQGGRAANTMAYDNAWLDRAPRLGNGLTHESLIPLCDELLSDIRQRQGLAGQVRGVLLQDIANPPDFEATARRLRVSSRSLRRQLGLQGTTFQKLLDEARAQVAARYLGDTAMTVEDVAFALGFSDAANFRHAFRRWTNRSPSEFRLAAAQ